MFVWVDDDDDDDGSVVVAADDDDDDHRTEDCQSQKNITPEQSTTTNDTIRLRLKTRAAKARQMMYDSVYLNVYIQKKICVHNKLPPSSTTTRNGENIYVFFILLLYKVTDICTLCVYVSF